MAVLEKETVLDVHHWNESLFSFKTTRDLGFRFKNGHFTMLGLEVDGKPCSAPTVLPAPITRKSWNFSASRCPMVR